MGVRGLMRGTVTVLMFATVCGTLSAQKTALKTNLFYDATTTLNIGVERILAPKWTLDISANYNPWTFSDNKKWKHWLVQPELRRWNKEAFRGGFWAAHLLGGQFNFGGWSTDFSFLGTDYSVLKDNRIEGWGIGAGIGYGYAWRIAKCWNIEAELALGYIYMDYDKYACSKCGEKITADNTHHYFGPTKVALSLVYLFPGKKTQVAKPQPVESIVLTYKPQLCYAYAKPVVEQVKRRTEDGCARLGFAVNKYDIRPDFGDNAQELAKIRKSVELVERDSDVTITGIQLHGYASPDGRYGSNDRLATNRTNELRKYLEDYYPDLDKQLFEANHTAEDWDSVRRFVAASDLANREAMLEVIDSDLQPDAKDAKLKKDYPEQYSYIYNNVYPEVRRTDYRITYNVRNFSLEEAQRIIKERPQKLSLQEMFLVANSYEEGSPDYCEVFEVAVRMFPSDETANVNAANTALRRGDKASADRYLLRAGTSPEAQNARGILALRNGDRESALRLFQQAADAGLQEAKENLEEMNKQVNY